MKIYCSNNRRDKNNLSSYEGTGLWIKCSYVKDETPIWVKVLYSFDNLIKVEYVFEDGQLTYDEGIFNISELQIVNPIQCLTDEEFWTE